MASSLDLITNPAEGVAEGAKETEDRRVFTLDGISSFFLGGVDYCKIREGDTTAALYCISPPPTTQMPLTNTTPSLN